MSEEALKMVVFTYMLMIIYRNIAWHNDGKLLNKYNSFTDFITCTEYLIAK